MLQVTDSTCPQLSTQLPALHRIQLVAMKVDGQTYVLACLCRHQSASQTVREYKQGLHTRAHAYVYSEKCRLQAAGGAQVSSHTCLDAYHVRMRGGTACHPRVDHVYHQCVTCRIRRDCSRSKNPFSQNTSMFAGAMAPAARCRCPQQCTQVAVTWLTSWATRGT